MVPKKTNNPLFPCSSANTIGDECPFDCQDINEDGIVDISDLLMVFWNSGPICSPFHQPLCPSQRGCFIWGMCGVSIWCI